MEAAGTRCPSFMGKRCTATRISLTKSGEMLEHGSLVKSGAHLQCQEDPYLYTATSTRAATRKVEDAEYRSTRTVVLRRTTVLEVLSTCTRVHGWGEIKEVQKRPGDGKGWSRRWCSPPLPANPRAFPGTTLRSRLLQPARLVSVANRKRVSDKRIHECKQRWVALRQH